MTIHLLEDARFRTVPSSRAFPGWTAAEIHRALNEPELSDATMATLRKIGRTLGAALGTGPDDDPLLRTERMEGPCGGPRGDSAGCRPQVLTSRGLRVSAAFPRRLAELNSVSTAALIQAALECRDEAHFLRLIGRKHH